MRYNNSCSVCNSNNGSNCNCSCSGNNANACNCNGSNNSCGSNNSNNSSNCNNSNDNITTNSLQENLRNFVGRRVTLEFSICGNCSKKTGILTCVGSNFLTLRGINNSNCLLCDTAGLNFVTVHPC